MTTKKFLTWVAVFTALAMILAACAGSPATDVTVADSHVEDDHAEDDNAEDDHAEDGDAVDDHTEDDHSDDPDQDGEADHDDSEGEARTVEIVMSEFAFAPSTVEVSAGETIRFLVKNEGVVPHEFRLSNDHRIEEHLAAGHAGHEEGGHHDEAAGDKFIEVEPGMTGELVFTFPEDLTVYTDIACLIEGHHEAGMYGELTYKEA